MMDRDRGAWLTCSRARISSANNSPPASRESIDKNYR
jgi:hypothetical protein